MGRPKKRNAKVTSMRLEETTRQLAELVGGGNVTRGIEQLFARLPLFHQVRHHLDTSMDELIDKLAALAVTPERWDKGTKAELIYGLKEACQMAVDLREQAHVLSEEMDQLEIDRVYDEAVTEGILTVEKDGKVTAWIV